jgi:hypothetical protein
MVRRARSSLKALGKPKLFADALNYAFPRPDSGDLKMAPETALPISNADLSRLIATRLKLSNRAASTLEIQLGKYRSAHDIPTRKQIGMLSEGLGVPPMVLLIYAGHLNEFFGYLEALACLQSSPEGWPLKRSRPTRAAIALAFSTFPTFDDDQSAVARQATTAVEMIMRGRDVFSYNIGEPDRRDSQGAISQYLAGSTTDGAFILPARPSYKDVEIRAPSAEEGLIVIRVGSNKPDPPLPEGSVDYEFTLRSECQVDVSGELATWVFRNIEPLPLSHEAILRRALTTLEDASYPLLGRFELAGVICEQWAMQTNSQLANEVLSNLWRWDRQELPRKAAAALLRERSQHAVRLPRRLRRLFGRSRAHTGGDTSSKK